MHFRQAIPESQLRTLVRRLLRISRPDIDTPVIVSTSEVNHHCSVGRLIEREGARLSALMDIALEQARAVKVFLPESAYVGEVMSCVAKGDEFTVELALIMSQGPQDGTASKARVFAATSS